VKKTTEEANSGKSKTLDEASAMSSLRAKLKLVDSEIQHYVTALEAENLKFQKQIGKLQAENVTLNSRITVLEETIEEVKRQNEVSAIVKLTETLKEQRVKK
jgi:predicted  nucleic acid-binding Zn-ribbon protein